MKDKTTPEQNILKTALKLLREAADAIEDAATEIGAWPGNDKYAQNLHHRARRYISFCDTYQENKEEDDGVE